MAKAKIVSKSKTTHELLKKIECLESLCYQLQNMIDNVPGDVYWKNKEGIWIGLNTRCAQSLQRMGFINDAVDSEIIGKTDHQIFSKTTADEYKKNDQDRYDSWD